MQLKREIEETQHFLPTSRYAFVQGNFWMSFCIIFSFASVYLLSKGFQSSQIGIIIAIAGVVSAILQPAVAGIADKSYKITVRKLIEGFSIVMILMAVILLIPNLHFILIAFVYAALVAVLQIITPLVNAVGMECINHGIPINFGIARGMGSILYAAISYIAGALVSKFSTNVIPIMIIIFYSFLFFSILTFQFKGMQKGIVKDHFQEEKTKNAKTIDFVKNNQRFFLLLLGITICFASHNILNNYIYQIVKSHGGGSAQMGTALSIAAAVELPTMLLFSVIISRVKSSKLIIIAAFFFAIKSLLTLLAGNMTAIYLTQLSQALGFALFVPASVYYVNHVIKEKDRVKGQAFMTVTNTVGSIAGSLIGGVLIDRAGVSVMLLVSTVIAGIGAVIVVFGVDHNK